MTWHYTTSISAEFWLSDSYTIKRCWLLHDVTLYHHGDLLSTHWWVFTAKLAAWRRRRASRRFTNQKT